MLEKILLVHFVKTMKNLTSLLLFSSTKAGSQNNAISCYNQTLKCQNHIVHLCNCIIITKDQEIEIQYKCEMEIVL